MYALIIGAGSQIGTAAIALLREQTPRLDIIAISRHASAIPADVGITALDCDYSEASIKDIATRLAYAGGQITRVIVCLGILHTDEIKPEKRMEELNTAQMSEVLRINAILPALWLSALLPLLKGRQACNVAVLSARVGSITDNRKGGWYSYRASKAALNMLLQTCAIEYGRRAPNVGLLAYHPGTVDTPLSAPFQRSVTEGNLFTPAYTAQCLLDLMEQPTPSGAARYVDHAGEAIAW